MKNLRPQVTFRSLISFILAPRHLAPRPLSPVPRRTVTPLHAYNYNDRQLVSYSLLNTASRLGCHAPTLHLKYHQPCRWSPGLLALHFVPSQERQDRRKMVPGVGHDISFLFSECVLFNECFWSNECFFRPSFQAGKRLSNRGAGLFNMSCGIAGISALIAACGWRVVFACGGRRYPRINSLGFIDQGESTESSSGIGGRWVAKR